MAANYLGRSKGLNLSDHKIRLSEVFNKSNDPFIRMTLATAFGKSKDADFIPVLRTGLLTESDYRVKANILRAMGNYEYQEVKDVILPYLKDQNVHLASLAADFVLEHGIKEDAELYQSFVSDSTEWQVKTVIDASRLKHTPSVFYEIEKFYF
jgi:HEAT repeat protein